MRFGFRHFDFVRHSLAGPKPLSEGWSFVIRHLPPRFVFYLLSSPLPLLAATNTNTDSIPPLQPPRAELPPSFWEEHGTSVVLFGVVLFAFICIAVWWLSRSRPQAVVPPEVQAREALELLQSRAEEGALLSRVSQILRRYFVQAFELPLNELTTTEFCALIGGAQQIGPQLAASVSEFLRRCDQRKFAPAPDPQPPGAVANALKLIELGEARRVELRQAEQPSEAVKR